MEWFAMVWPVLSMIVLYRYFSSKTVWWELILPLGCALISIFLCKVIIEKINISDREYLDSVVSKTENHDPWVEMVPCVHYQTVTVGKTTYTRQMHPFDLCYHPRRCYLVCKHGSHEVSLDYYTNLMKKVWKNEKTHTPIRPSAMKNGDIHTSKWDEQFNHMETMTFTRNYDNKVQSSKSIFNFHELAPEDKKQYHLFDYPSIGHMHRGQSILGYQALDEDRVLLNRYNSMLGDIRSLRIWFVAFYNQPLVAGHAQESLWKGGNRNDIVITVGLNSDNKVQWVYPFSWAENETPKFAIRDYIAMQKTFDLSSAIKFSYEQVKDDVYVRDFTEFDYLETAISGWQIILIHILTIGVCIGIGYWVVNNDINEEPNVGKYSLEGKLLSKRR
jgi:hypothetical protein